MTFNTLLILLLLASVLGWLHWRRCSRVLFGLALLIGLATGCGPLPIWLLSHLQSEVAVPAPVVWGQHNVIVLLGAGTVRVIGTGAVEASFFAYGRISKTAMLYHACRQAERDCKVEVSGGDARGLGQSEAAIYAGDLQRLGVDPADLLLEPRSLNTWQNAQFSGPLLKAYGADRVLLVSSGFHLRRGELYFSHFGIHAPPVRADYVSGIASWLPLSYNFTMADMALHEYAGIARYHWYNAMGWNVQATRAGAL
ncbi:YdcF family protein [Rhodanobacter sp. AS-Z3]|uniref:YdcF family protein n=1 Tax=Rhodanobacter sp. AS-Z3 TaxID=3031330 RepID=UPI00247B2D47|nr:YdcF family protein [Rhodanobacter sp. AS-Z3]WEN13933.1 YdcF family protein [Rhodanobacter sp. AS-Z3]